MGLAMLVDVREIKDKAILGVATTPVTAATQQGQVDGNGSAGIAVAHYGSNNMMAFRYRLRTTADEDHRTGRSPSKGPSSPPARSSLPRPPILTAVRRAVQELGLTAAAFASTPSVPMHDADVPRVAIYSSWIGTQEIGWVRYTFDRFGVPFDLIYKERVRKGNLRTDYDVIVMPTQTLNTAVGLPAAGGQSGAVSEGSEIQVPRHVRRVARHHRWHGRRRRRRLREVPRCRRHARHDGHGIALPGRSRAGADRGCVRDDVGQVLRAAAARQAEVLRLDHPVFYGYTDKLMPIKYIQGQPLMSVAEADRGPCWHATSAETRRS